MLTFIILEHFHLSGRREKAKKKNSPRKLDIDELDEETKDRDVYHPVHKWYEAAKKEPLFNRKFKRGISGREEWWENGQEALKKAIERQKLNQNVAKNVIIFIGDGMGVSTVSAARIMEGYDRDDEVPGEQNYLSFEKFPYTGLAKVGCEIYCTVHNAISTWFWQYHVYVYV